MDNIIFETQEKTKQIDLSTLRKTISLSEFSGKLPKTKPIEHYQLIDMIGDKLTAKNYSFDLDPIFVSKNESKRIMKLDPDNHGLPESYLFQRIVTRAKITSISSSDKHESCIAIGYTERGLQIAVGINVTVCQNMSIFGGHLLKSHGDNRMPYEKLIEMIDKYISELPEIYEKDDMILNSMNDIKISESDVIHNIGLLQLLAVEGAYYGRSDNPLNIGQVSSFSSGIIKDHGDLIGKADIEDIDETGGVSLYDFYNRGTQILHPKKADISTVWEDVEKWGSFLTEKYNIN